MNEYLDGSGYPKGLTASEIGLPSRILAVTNAFCAMVKPRAYRPSIDVAETLAYLAETKEKYDPHVVQALERVVESATGEKILS